MGAVSTLRVWDLNEAAQHERDDLAVPCDPAGDSFTAPPPGAFLTVINGLKRRSRTIRIQYPGTIVNPEPGDATFTIPPRKTMMFGPFGPHFEIQPDPEVFVTYPGGTRGLRVFACAQLTEPRPVVTRSAGIGPLPA